MDVGVRKRLGYRDRSRSGAAADVSDLRSGEQLFGQSGELRQRLGDQRGSVPCPERCVHRTSDILAERVVRLPEPRPESELGRSKQLLHRREIAEKGDLRSRVVLISEH